MSLQNSASGRLPFLVLVGVLSLGGGFSVGVSPARAQATETHHELPLEALLRAVQERYRGFDDLRMRFLQRQQRRRGSVVVESTGVWVIRTPNLVRVEYDGSGRTFVADGEAVYWYVPEDNQVHIYPAEKAGAGQLPIAYLAGQGDLVGDFHVSGTEWEERLQPGNVQLQLDPRADGTDFQRLVVEIDPDTALIARLVSFGRLGESTEYRFLTIETDVGVSDELFRFEIPPGVDVEYRGS